MEGVLAVRLVRRQDDRGKPLAFLDVGIGDPPDHQLALEIGADTTFRILLDEQFHSLGQLSLCVLKMLHSEAGQKVILLAALYLGGSQLFGITFHLDIVAWLGKDDLFAEIGEDDKEGSFLSKRRLPLELSINNVDGVSVVYASIGAVNKEITLTKV